MPHLKKKKNLKLQLSPGLVASYDIQPGNGSGSIQGHKTHTHILTHLLTFPRPTRASPPEDKQKIICSKTRGI